MGWRLRKSDSLGKLRQRERFSFRNSKYSAGDQFECFSNGRLDLLLRCGREPAREEKPLDNLGLVNDRPGEYRDGELVGFGLAMRRERTVDNHFPPGARERDTSAPSPYRLHLREAAVYEQLRSRDVAAVVRC